MVTLLIINETPASEKKATNHLFSSIQHAVGELLVNLTTIDR